MELSHHARRRRSAVAVAHLCPPFVPALVPHLRLLHHSNAVDVVPGRVGLCGGGIEQGERQVQQQQRHCESERRTVLVQEVTAGEKVQLAISSSIILFRMSSWRYLIS